MQNIILYNSMFTFTSVEGKVDTEINNVRGPYVFRMNGQKYHKIGTVLPEGKENHAGHSCTPMTLQMR